MLQVKFGRRIGPARDRPAMDSSRRLGPEKACNDVVNRRQSRCTPAWQEAQSVIRFCSESSPEWLRNFVWWISRVNIAPHDWHLQPSRRSTCLRSWSYNSLSRRMRVCFGRTALKRFPRSPDKEMSSCPRSEGS